MSELGLKAVWPIKEEVAWCEEQHGTMTVAADPMNMAATQWSKAFLRAVVIAGATDKAGLHSCDVRDECLIL